jgi:hypothetical protein
MVGSFQTNRDAAFAERKSNPINCSGHTERVKIDRLCISQDATYGGNFAA